MDKTKYFSTKELMGLLRVSRFAIYRANLSGALPIAYKKGTQNYYKEEDVINYLKQSGEAKIAQN